MLVPGAQLEAATIVYPHPSTSRQSFEATALRMVIVKRLSRRNSRPRHQAHVGGRYSSLQLVFTFKQDWKLVRMSMRANGFGVDHDMISPPSTLIVCPVM